MSITLDEFVQSITTSGLMDADEIQSFITTLPMEQQPRTAEDLAKELFRQGKFTKFQAQAIYQKKTRGLVVGNYVVLDKLGKGGMGAVYKARHRRMDRIVALKMLPSSATKSQDAVQRFQRETKAAAKLTHPNIVTAHDADEAKGVHFLVMEYVEGQDLHALVKGSGTLSVARAVDYTIQSARGLEYAHTQGVIHRDIKPHNLLLDKKGTVKILDMGLARIGEVVAGDVVQDDGLTRSGQVMGTLDYMSPEQALDTKTADARADIYSLGCTLHYLLIGRPPYAGDTVGKKMLAHRMEPIPSLRNLRDDVSQSLDAVFQKLLAKEPEGRQQTMSEVISELQACALPQGNVLVPPSLPSGPGSYAETVDLQREDTAPPAESLSPFDELFANESIQITERLIAPSLRSTKSWKNRQNVVIAAVAGGVAVVLLLLGIILKTRTSEGTLVVEINEPDATVQVLNEQGKVLIERKSQKGTLTIGVDPGKRRLRVEKDGFEVFAKELSIASGGKETVKAGLEPKPGIANVQSGQSSPATPPAESPQTSPDKPVKPRRAVTSSDTVPPPAIAPFDPTKAGQYQEAWANHLGISVKEINSIGMELVLIPPGEFEMGSTSEEIAWTLERATKKNPVDEYYMDRVPSEAPRHPIKITKPFYLAMYHLTQAQYEKVVGVNPSTFTEKQMDASMFTPPLQFVEREKHRRTIAGKDTSRHPVETVNWDEAIEFCRRLSAIPAERAAGRIYRLPTEAEWEYACRAGTTTRWYCGDDESGLLDVAWFGKNDGGMTQPVGKKKPNAWRLYDMHGNVWQWCADGFSQDYYKQSSPSDPTGPAKYSHRVVRGGHWYNFPFSCRSACRNYYGSATRSFHLGFRVVMEISDKGEVGKQPTPSFSRPLRTRE